MPSNDDADLYTRALGMMQALAGAYSRGDTPWGPERGVVGRDTAADAIMDLFAIIDESLQTGATPGQTRLLHAMADLMVIREAIVALPSPEGDEELLRSDLERIRDALRDSRKRFGLPE